MASTDEIVAEILRTEEARCQAVATENWSALAEIAGGDFTYTHSTGKTETRDEWVAGISKDRRDIEHDRLKVRLITDDVALLTGGSTNHYDRPFTGDSHYGVVLDILQVWVKRDGKWMLVAQHGVKDGREKLD
jgi:hypothetical protein